MCSCWGATLPDVATRRSFEFGLNMGTLCAGGGCGFKSLTFFMSAVQKAVVDSTFSSVAQEPRRPWGPPEPPEPQGKNAKRPRDDSFLPLVIPVSVPVRRLEASSPGRDEAALESTWPYRPPDAPDLSRDDHKLSVIVTRRRSLRNSLTESLEVGSTQRLSVCLSHQWTS